ncbi:MAG: hypothetical protein NZ455_01155 [Bacteroidia bacterium]|nr:hypothetical protein [Bacteroidia bacterium]
MGVSLPTSRCARVGKVGVLRATLSLRCCALLRTLRMPHASSLQMFYLVLKRIFALPCLTLIIKYLQGKNFLSCLNSTHFILIFKHL